MELKYKRTNIHTHTYYSVPNVIIKYNASISITNRAIIITK